VEGWRVSEGRRFRRYESMRVLSRRGGWGLEVGGVYRRMDDRHAGRRGWVGEWVVVGFGGGEAMREGAGWYGCLDGYTYS
jgi:hypothetical protein